MVTKRQLESLKKKLSLKPGGVYIFDEIDGQLVDDQGQVMGKKELKELSDQENVVIIIDDIGG